MTSDLRRLPVEGTLDEFYVCERPGAIHLERSACFVRFEEPVRDDAVPFSETSIPVSDDARLEAGLKRETLTEGTRVMAGVQITKPHRGSSPVRASCVSLTPAP